MIRVCCAGQHGLCADLDVDYVPRSKLVDGWVRPGHSGQALLLDVGEVLHRRLSP